jgi:hypothetical protein
MTNEDLIELSIDELQNEMEQLHDNSDVQMRHIRADDILCEVLRREGYHNLVDMYQSMGKWYA